MIFKFTRLFKIENKIEKQAYRLMLSSIHRIYNIFHIFLLKSYHYKIDDKNAHKFMQVLNLINDNEQ